MCLRINPRNDRLKESQIYLIFFYILLQPENQFFSPSSHDIPFKRKKECWVCVCACLYTSLLQERSFGMLWNFLLLYFSLFSSSCCCCASCACKNIQTAFFFGKSQLEKKTIKNRI